MININDFMTTIEFNNTNKLKESPDDLAIYARKMELALLRTFSMCDVDLENKILVLESCDIPYDIKVYTTGDTNDKGIATEIVRKFVFDDNPIINKFNVNTDKLVDSNVELKHKSEGNVFDINKTLMRKEEATQLINDIIDSIDEDKDE